ncbi:MAG: endonuclease III [Clostridia bacterium]|nr:endonuclease III [Clostridia bacterium]
MTQKQKKERMAQIVEKLKEIYPDALCALEWEGEPWKLLIMGRLSAQCTDARVNLVCRELFAAHPTPEAIANAELSDLEAYIRPCGLYHVKAQNTKDACAMLVNEYGGVLPDSMEELLRFPGVGRKVANLLLGDLYGKGGVVADTHCIRICGRFGMYPETLKDPVRVERLMTPLLEPQEISDFCHRIVQFGRDVCSARAPQCTACPLSELCEHAQKAAKKA